MAMDCVRSCPARICSIFFAAFSLIASTSVSACCRMVRIFSSPSVLRASTSSLYPMLFHREKDHRGDDETEDHHSLRDREHYDDGSAQLRFLCKGAPPRGADF